MVGAVASKLSFIVSKLSFILKPIRNLPHIEPQHSSSDGTYDLKTRNNNMTDLVKRMIAYQQSRGGAHHAGTLTVAPLERIIWYYENYFKGKPVNSVETGCGASTIVFSHYSKNHTAYCYDDRNDDNSSVNFALDFPEFVKDRVKWVFGPTQRTVLSNPLDHDVDLILIDGPHGYPFPDLEYFAFYKRLKPGGLLIIDDIHIPTINNLYKFLLQDDSFYSHGVAATTAYFLRSDRPSFDMEGDGWYLQRYNVQGFPAVNHEDASAGSVLPVTFDFDGKLANAQPLLTRGFSLQNGRPVTEGDISIIDIKIAPQTPKKVKITFDIEPICVEERAPHAPGFKIAVNGKQISDLTFENSDRRTIEIEAETNGTQILRIEFWHCGTIIANDLKNWKKSAWVWYDGRHLNFWLHFISVADAAAPSASTNIVRRTDGSVVSFDHENERISFFVDEFEDSIQSFHVYGRFYEYEELEAIRRIVPPSARILDVGAHVGNHSVFFSKYLGAEKVVVVEPNPRTQSTLRLTCVLNGLSNFDLSRVDYALGASPGEGRVVTTEKYNSAATTIDSSHGGPVKIVRGEDLFADEDFDFIKIDVEGMEIEVIDGLAKLIVRNKPALFVDAKSKNSAKLVKRIHDFGYAIAWQSQDYVDHVHYLMINMPTTSRVRKGN
jgi:FkbM family methyltransferase